MSPEPTTGDRWLVIDHAARGMSPKLKPKRLHLRDCPQSSSTYRGVPGPMRPPVGAERHLPKCQSCLEKEKQRSRP